jgi:hypothetical protein
LRQKRKTDPQNYWLTLYTYFIVKKVAVMTIIYESSVIISSPKRTSRSVRYIWLKIMAISLLYLLLRAGGQNISLFCYFLWLVFRVQQRHFSWPLTWRQNVVTVCTDSHVMAVFMDRVIAVNELSRWPHLQQSVYMTTSMNAINTCGQIPKWKRFPRFLCF